MTALRFGFADWASLETAEAPKEPTAEFVKDLDSDNSAEETADDTAAPPGGEDEGEADIGHQTVEGEERERV